MAAAVVNAGPKLAPHDPTLPAPWKALIDGNTGYIYYWNTESNVTQYEKPLPPVPQAPPASVAASDLVVRLLILLASNVNPSFKTTANVDHLSPMAVDAYRRQHEISVLGDNVPSPFMNFDQTGFPPEVLQEFQVAGFSSPTPIQAQSWPIALQSRDIVAIAKTGSGKTLGYLLPAFMQLRRCRNNPRLGPTVLVLAPTRELATQIQDEAIKFGKSSRISSTCLYGGAPKPPQIRDLERGVDIVVATPGRLNDILEMRKINLRQVSFLILDEADRMLDMGFEPQIRKVVNELPRQRQTLMYTATWPKEVRKIAADLLVNPVQVTIGTIDELAANKSITQFVEIVAPFDKQRRVEQILRGQEPGSRVVIFCSTKRMCDQLARSLGRQFGATAIHGDKSQGERDSVLGNFRSGRMPVLVATDVAARGLDIKDIRVVINYDFPTGVEDYVHRIGRTGRAGASGLAHTFFSDQDGKFAAELIKVLERAEQKVPPELREIAARYSNSGRGRGGRGDFGSRGGRDGNRGFGGGRGDSFANGRGAGSAWGTASTGGRFDRDSTNGFNGSGYYGKIENGGSGYRGSASSDRYERGRHSSRSFDGRESSRNSYRKADEWGWEKDLSYGRSYSRSPSRSRNRSYGSSSKSRSRSRSRSRSYDRYDYRQRSPERNFYGSTERRRSPARERTP